MKILLTGASGYIGKRLLPVLLRQGHKVVCSVRNKAMYSPPGHEGHLELAEADFLRQETLADLPLDIDIAFYLIHSMSSVIDHFEDMEALAARNFMNYIDRTSARQIIYLGGIDNNPQLSPHLLSRRNVERILQSGRVPATSLKAGIIVGAGSASFEIIRDLVEKLPLMVAPRWLNTRCQPIAIHDVIQYLTGVMDHPATFGKSFEIGGKEVLSYKEMLLQYAEVRKLRRYIFTLPVMTPKLSSYWLYFITSTSYKLAVNLVNSMKVDVVCREQGIHDILPLEPLTYRDAIRRAFGRIEQNQILSSWKDALSASSSLPSLSGFIQVPVNGTFSDRRAFLLHASWEQVLENIWTIGGDKGWYYGTILWKIRGLLDKLAGGIGLRRGRTHPSEIHAGDALDFWRVLVADKKEGRLLLYAEMKLPGEAWLEFRLKPSSGSGIMQQTATFRPNGLAGRLYWYLLIPLHFFIFRGMGRRIAGRE